MHCCKPLRPLAAALLLAGTAFAVPPRPAAALPPALAFQSEVCDLGNMVQGERPECVFAFANAGDEELHILDVEPSCGCTTALLSAPRLAAAARGAVRVVFDSDAFAGEVVKEVTVRSNDPLRPNVILRLKALVEPEIDFEPRVVTFDDVLPGAAQKQLVLVTNRGAAPARLLRLEAQPSSYRCLLPSWTDRSRPLVLESWDRVGLEVLFTSPARLAMAIAGECTLEIEGPRKRHFTLKLLALPSP